MKKKKWLWVLLLIPVILLALITDILFWLRVPTSYQAVQLLENALDQERQSGTIHIDTAQFQGNLSFFWTEVRDERFYAVDMEIDPYYTNLVGDTALYYNDGAVFFSNGRGYDLSNVLKLDSLPDELDADLLLLAGFEKYESENGTHYHLQLTDELYSILVKFFPDAQYILDEVKKGDLTLTEDNGRLASISVHYETNNLQIDLDKRPTKSIPAEVLMEILASTPTDIRTLSALYNAGVEMLTQRVFAADIELSMESGPLSIKDDARLYSVDGAMYFERSERIQEISPYEGTDTGTMLLGLGWMMCRDGIWDPEGSGSGTYSLSIDPQILDFLLLTMIPELEGLGVELKEGSISLVVRNNRMEEMTMSCYGDLPVLITSIPLNLSVALDRMDGEIQLPDAINGVTQSPDAIS